MTKTKTLFLILTLAAATATACARTVGVTGTDNQPRIINIVNFIRQTDYRVEDSDRKLYETVCRQVELVNRYDLPATFLLEYDALINPLYQKLLKTKLRNGAEIGAWWELTQPHIEAAGLKWRGEHPWVSHANIAFSTGYTKEERERLVDVYMRKFKDVFGTYPKSVGSWFIDAHTLAYMHDRYGIEASCNCKDQIGTDGYTLWGGYWNQAYYPSRLNAYMPAQTGAGQIPVPVFRMLGSDPIYQYDDGLGNERQGVISLEPVYKDLPCWSEDISAVRSFADLPSEAKKYVAFCLKAIIDIASRDGNLKAKPNLRYIGVGPMQSQIIRDVPSTEELLKFAQIE